MNQKPFVYLAGPYSHPSAAVRRGRFHALSKTAGELMQKGFIVYSPISHTHPIAEQCELPKDWEYWEKFDRAYLEHSWKLVVLKMEGWEESTGVQAEIAIAEELGIPIKYKEWHDEYFT